MHPAGLPGWSCACGAHNPIAAGECHRCDAPRPPTGPPLPTRAAPRRNWVNGYGLASGTAFLLAIIIYTLFLAPRRATPTVSLPASTGTPPAQFLPAATASRPVGPWYNAGQPSSAPPQPAAPERQWTAPPTPTPTSPVVWMPPVRLTTPPPPPVVYLPARPQGAWTSAPAFPQGSLATPDEVVRQVRGSVVLVLARRGRTLRHGAGFPLGPRHLLTCAHLLEQATEVLLVTPDGRQLRVAGGETDPANDLALLMTDGELPAPLALAGDTVPVGEPVAVTGFPNVGDFLNSGRGLYADSVPGVVSARVNRVSPSNFAVDSLRIDAEVRPGYSGGPVYSVRTGAVVGMLSFRVAHDRVEGYAAPATAIRALLARLGTTR